MCERRGGELGEEGRRGGGEEGRRGGGVEGEKGWKERRGGRIRGKRGGEKESERKERNHNYDLQETQVTSGILHTSPSLCVCLSSSFFSFSSLHPLFLPCPIPSIW